MGAVVRFGVHWAAGDMAFLLQRDGYQTAYDYHIDSPFTINKQLVRVTCPHKIDLRIADDRLLGEAPLDDPVFQSMLPVPVGNQKTWFSTVDREIIFELRRLFQPTRNDVSPVWYFSQNTLGDRMRSSNLGTMVFTDARLADMTSLRRLNQISSLSERRTLVLASEVIPTPFAPDSWCDTNLTLAEVKDMPLEAIGATVLRQYMRTGKIDV